VVTAVVPVKMFAWSKHATVRSSLKETDFGKMYLICLSSDIKNSSVFVQESPRTGSLLCPEPQCGRSFAHTTQLNAHIKWHRGEGNFVCPYPGCELQLSRRYTLMIHIRTHTGEKPFSCSVCGKTFTVLEGLQKHRKVHVVEASTSRSEGKKLITHLEQ
jgi:KRAB domain-containing zinc finger protein